MGSPAAPSTLTVYEDFRCPACDGFEQNYRSTIHELEDSGQLKAEYHLATLIDGNLGGTGSLNAANAAACAQDVRASSAPTTTCSTTTSPRRRTTPSRTRARLLDLAEKVPGLRTPAFTSCVQDGTHDTWVDEVQQRLRQRGLRLHPDRPAQRARTSTPTGTTR